MRHATFLCIVFVDTYILTILYSADTCHLSPIISTLHSSLSTPMLLTHLHRLPEKPGPGNRPRLLLMYRRLLKHRVRRGMEPVPTWHNKYYEIICHYFLHSQWPVTSCQWPVKNNKPQRPQRCFQALLNGLRTQSYLKCFILS